MTTSKYSTVHYITLANEKKSFSYKLTYKSTNLQVASSNSVNLVLFWSNRTNFGLVLFCNWLFVFVINNVYIDNCNGIELHNIYIFKRGANNKQTTPIPLTCFVFAKQKSYDLLCTALANANAVCQCHAIHALISIHSIICMNTTHQRVILHHWFTNVNNWIN